MPVILAFPPTVKPFSILVLPEICNFSSGLTVFIPTLPARLTTNLAALSKSVTANAVAPTFPPSLILIKLDKPTSEAE